MYLNISIQNYICHFSQQGAKLEVLSVICPPFVTKMDPSVGSEKYYMEGPNPDIWFALQVVLIRIDTFEFSSVKISDFIFRAL